MSSSAAKMAANEAENRRSAPSSNLSQRIVDFSGYTTFHGAHFVVGPERGIFRRVFWFLLILTGLGFLGRQLIKSYQKLQANDHVMTRKIIPAEKELVFPAVTICNVNMMKKVDIQGTDAQAYLDQLNVFMKKYYEKGGFGNKTISSSFDIEKAVLQYGHTASDMVLVCTWDGKLCNPLNFTTRFSQIYGLCHTFNSGRDGHPLLSSSSAKRNRGLHLLLDVNKANYYGMTSYFNTGIRMVIHHQDEEPMVEADGIDVMPGHMTTMKIQRTEYNSLEPPHGSACGTKDLKTSNAYTQSTCLLECNTRRVIKQCACRLLGMPDLPELNGTKYCNPKEITSCLFTNLTTMSRDDLPETVLVKYFIKYDGQPSDNPGAKCGCPKPCKQFPYKITQLNTVVLMSDSFFDDYLAAYAVIDVFAKAATNWFRRRLREDYIYLIIYYDDLNTLKTSEKLAYDFTDFGSDVGGYLGLFLGCSVLTVFEIFDFIVCYCFGRRRARSEMEQVREANERSHFV